MWDLLAEILLLISTAFVLGALAQRLKQSPILGYLMAGTIIGPCCLIHGPFLTWPNWALPCCFFPSVWSFPLDA
jgi:Kef-type K+ transport system membrane component KefB